MHISKSSYVGRTLAIIGAGPKALAVAAKTQVLWELGFEVPQVHIFEKEEVGAHWTGKHGFTNGQLLLGTAPEKDIGFPYQTELVEGAIREKINAGMLRFSWASYLVSLNKYSEWVDEGKPSPTHMQWAEYLKHCAALFDSRVITIHKVRVTEAAAQSGAWKISAVDETGAARVFRSDALMFTGPGSSRSLFDDLKHDHILDSKSFWANAWKLRDRKSQTRIAIVGAGETAASMAVAISHLENEFLELDVISPTGFLFSRGESYFENRVYSSGNSEEWRSIALADRLEFVHRTDWGVFSNYAMSQISSKSRVKVIPGKVTELRASTSGRIDVLYSYNLMRQFKSYDFVVVASGNNQLQFIKDVLNHETQANLARHLGEKQLSGRAVSLSIGHDLSVEGFYPQLFLPMLSHLQQGPGFANLSALGGLSDRVLSHQVACAALRLESV